ncbi:hypothetical protein P9112_005547 [Eukaryota sp. TZLM1-RC]
MEASQQLSSTKKSIIALMLIHANLLRVHILSFPSQSSLQTSYFDLKNNQSKSKQFMKMMYDVCSTMNDAVKNQSHTMCSSYHDESFVEPLLRSLDINESVRDSKYKKRRADAVVPSFDDVLNVLDVGTVDVCKKIP